MEQWITMIFLAGTLWAIVAASERCLYQTSELDGDLKIGAIESLSVVAVIMVVGLMIEVARGLVISVVMIKIISGIVN
jgi:hypothetical protein